jgi:hypothetical protein
MKDQISKNSVRYFFKEKYIELKDIIINVHSIYMYLIQFKRHGFK